MTIERLGSLTVLRFHWQGAPAGVDLAGTETLWAFSSLRRAGRAMSSWYTSLPSRSALAVLRCSPATTYRTARDRGAGTESLGGFVTVALSRAFPNSLTLPGHVIPLEEVETARIKIEIRQVPSISRPANKETAPRPKSSPSSTASKNCPTTHRCRGERPGGDARHLLRHTHRVS
jgi:hypothetical protein